MKRTLKILLLAGGLVSGLTGIFAVSAKPTGTVAAPTSLKEPTVLPSLPPLNANLLVSSSNDGIPRYIQLKTEVSDGPTNEITEYVVKRGDSPWSIAQKFNLKPETILWGNPQLNAAAGSLKAGDTLMILPVDGVLHIAEDTDTLEQIANLHGSPSQEIFEYLGNSAASIDKGTADYRSQWNQSHRLVGGSGAQRDSGRFPWWLFRKYSKSWIGLFQLAGEWIYSYAGILERSSRY